MSRKKSRSISTPVSIPQLEPRLLAIGAAASYLSTTIWNIRSLTWEGKLTPVKLGKSRRLLFDKSDLDAFIDAQKRAAA